MLCQFSHQQKTKGRKNINLSVGECCKQLTQQKIHLDFLDKKIKYDYTHNIIYLDLIVSNLDPWKANHICFSNICINGNYTGLKSREVNLIAGGEETIKLKIYHGDLKRVPIEKKLKETTINHIKIFTSKNFREEECWVEVHIQRRRRKPSSLSFVAACSHERN